MAGEKQDSVWPLPVFYFKVEIGSLGEIAFKEVSGMDAEAQVIEYRHGNSPQVFHNQDAGHQEVQQCYFEKRSFRSG